MAQPQYPIYQNRSFKMSTTELERQSLEAHVDLCAERYGHLEQELKLVQQGQGITNSRLNKMEEMIERIAATLTEKENNALRSIIKVAGALILALLGTLGGVLWYIIT
jgi:hypothetical protein